MAALPSVPTFCVLSFEGPDRYALAGGLGVRVAHLSETLARRGYETHLLFVGDPGLPGREERPPGALVWHRWCQWISAYYPAGVYDGEDGKLADFNESAPRFVVEEIVRPVLAAGGLPVIMGEEWHTAEAVARIHDHLRFEGLRDRCVLIWNANNTSSFHRIDWPRLRHAAMLTTVSHYMKHLMWTWGVDPVVIPNGIPTTLLTRPRPGAVAALRRVLDPDGDRHVLLKTGRFDPAKRWLMAVEAAARLKDRGCPVRLLASGGVEPHRWEVLHHAHRRGLQIRSVSAETPDWRALRGALRPVADADLIELNCFLPPPVLGALYRAVDAVLANSGHEPFGLFGLEAMAAGGVVYTGGTGEEYAFTPGAAVTVETTDPDEIVDKVLFHRHHPSQTTALRANARKQAAAFTWDRVTDLLLDKVAFAARHLRDRQPAAAGPAATRPAARDLVIYVVVHQPRRLRLPAPPLPAGADAEELEPLMFDEAMNLRYFRKVATSCYHPALDRLGALLDAELKLAIGFSTTFLDQAARWDPDLVERFRALVRHPHVELVAVEPRHSFVMLWDVDRFIGQMRAAADRLEAMFGVRPRTADTTELMMSDVLYHALALAGYEVGLIDGRGWVLQGRLPTRLYHAGQPLKLLVRHHALSDDVGYRFSDRSWECWPLMADRYASWLARNPGDVVVLGWDFETFGEHHRRETGIFEFLDALPAAVKRAGMAFATPTEVAARHGEGARTLPLPAFPATWAGSGGLEFFLGNPVQQALFQLMMQAYHKARLAGDPGLLDLALLLAQSDNLHLVQWYGRTGDEAAVSAYFTPTEWWALGPDGIAWEMQQVYKNFIACITPGLPPDPAGDEAAAHPEPAAPAAEAPPARRPASPGRAVAAPGGGTRSEASREALHRSGPGQDVTRGRPGSSCDLMGTRTAPRVRTRTEPEESLCWSSFAAGLSCCWFFCCP
jgi:alpha-amylase